MKTMNLKQSCHNHQNKSEKIESENREWRGGDQSGERDSSDEIETAPGRIKSVLSHHAARRWSLFQDT